MYKKPDVRFMFFIPLLIALTVISCVALLMQQMFSFTHSYLLEEQHELSEKISMVVEKSSEFLSKHQYDKVNIILKDIHADISIFDENKNILATNFDKNDVFVDDAEPQDGVIYHINVINSKHVKDSRKILIDGNTYYIKTSMSIEDMSNMLNRTERNIFITFLFGSFIVIILSLYMFFKVRNPFVKLQQSAVKISNGDLTNDIYIPKDGPLVELSIAIDKMAKKLKSQIESLKKTEEFRKNFIEDLSHEVKTPLTGILSSIGIMKEFESKFPEQLRKCTDILNNHANRLDSLIKQILSLAVIEDLSIHENKNFIKFYLNTSVENALISCKSALDHAGMKINFTLNETMEIMGDIVLIEQAVTNLIMNAIKYSKSSVIDVSISKKDANAIIIIQDYGIGIKQSDVEHIFNRFYRVDKARSRELGGSGLGLAIVKNIVLLHNGTINLESELNRGCKFIISLPIALN